MFSLSKLIILRKKGRFGYDSIVKRPSSVPEDLFNDLIQVCLESHTGMSRLVERYVPGALSLMFTGRSLRTGMTLIHVVSS